MNSDLSVTKKSKLNQVLYEKTIDGSLMAFSVGFMSRRWNVRDFDVSE